MQLQAHCIGNEECCGIVSVGIRPRKPGHSLTGQTIGFTAGEQQRLPEGILPIGRPHPAGPEIGHPHRDTHSTDKRGKGTLNASCRGLKQNELANLSANAEQHKTERLGYAKALRKHHNAVGH